MNKLFRYALFPSALVLTVGGSVLALHHQLDPALLPVIATAVWLPLVLLAERRWPRVARPAEPAERRADWSYFALTAAVVDPLSRAAIVGLVAVLATALPMSTMAALPLWLATPAVLLVGGLGDYWAHRFGHEWSWWWKLHAVHHAPHRMVALNNLRLHPVDLFLKLLFAVTPVLLLGFSPESIALAGAIKGLGVAFQHADLDLRHGPLNRLFATNSVHRWHHSARPEEANANYGGTLSVFDQLFGTYAVPPEAAEPARMGLFKDDGYPIHAVARATAAPLCWARCTANPAPDCARPR